MRTAAERYKKNRDAIRRLKSIHLQEIKILRDLISKRGLKYQLAILLIMIDLYKMQILIIALHNLQNVGLKVLSL